MNSYSDEVNSKHSNSSILGKRKKIREKRSHYLKKWLEKSTQHTLDVTPDYDFRDSNSTSQVNGNCWNPPYAFYGQRLFNAASDPSVFRYPNPYGYPPEPISLPLYPPILCPPPLSTHYPNPPAWGQPSPLRYPQTPQRKNRGSNNPKKIPINRNTSNIGVGNDFNRVQTSHLPSTNKYDPRNTSSVAGPNIDFASLPPVINHVPGPYDDAGQVDDTSGNQRRFSDPGIAQNPSFDQSQEESQDETDSDSSGPGGSQAENRLIMCLVDQIHSLKETNGKLCKALHDTRGELDTLKQQSAIWRSDSASNLRIPPQPSHPLSAPSPAGMANPSSASAMYSPGMLADLVREIRDAARIREDALYAKVRVLLEERTTTNKNQIHSNLTDKSKTNDRLGKLEEELHNLRLNQSRDESLSSPGSLQGYGPLSQSEQERLRLRAELNEERAARVTSDAHAHKLELLVTQLRSKRGHTPSQASSLNGSAISSTPDTLHMVLGPVTDL